ncbi:hypothetical protein ACJ6WF_41075 [Streptomyces sp. MMS24-I2-30]|uniref:hypothetical protein n=1 Tax=Streptomyces sp. MMS24-I2-30 TaxID=3351564 RepID=UPI0038968E42
MEGVSHTSVELHQCEPFATATAATPREGLAGGKLKLAKLGKAEESKLMPPFRQLVNSMLPKVDFPELLLEAVEPLRIWCTHLVSPRVAGRIPAWVRLCLSEIPRQA